MRVLLIEDDKLIGDGVHAGLKKMGFSVDWFTDGAIGQSALALAPYDVVILDLSLPKIDGLDILRFWRKNKQATPVLVLTARDAIEDRVTGLQAGADDYLCKPFALMELIARIQALIRRNNGQVTADLQHGDILYLPEKKQVFKAGEEVMLTAKEMEVLELFLYSNGRVLSKNLIQEKIYSWGEDISSNTVEVHIHNLRRKLGNNLIRTVYGVGYALDGA